MLPARVPHIIMGEFIKRKMDLRADKTMDSSSLSPGNSLDVEEKRTTTYNKRTNDLCRHDSKDKGGSK